MIYEEFCLFNFILTFSGLSIHTFHGNFFVRSTDLLSLPNVNPDHSFNMQIAIDENLDESNMVAFQTALLYTTTKGERITVLIENMLLISDWIFFGV